MVSTLLSLAIFATQAQEAPRAELDEAKVRGYASRYPLRAFKVPGTKWTIDWFGPMKQFDPETSKDGSAGSFVSFGDVDRSGPGLAGPLSCYAQIFTYKKDHPALSSARAWTVDSELPFSLAKNYLPQKAKLTSSQAFRWGDPWCKKKGVLFEVGITHTFEAPTIHLSGISLPQVMYQQIDFIVLSKTQMLALCFDLGGNALTPPPISASSADKDRLAQTGREAMELLENPNLALRIKSELARRIADSIRLTK